MSCPTVLTIQNTECIGNSLFKINDNFTNLRIGTCDNFTRVQAVDAENQVLDTRITTLSAQTVPGLAKVWCKFDGTRDVTGASSTFNTNRFIYSSVGIASVLRKSIGDYRVYFTSPLPGPNYAALATSNEKQDTGGLYMWMQPYRYASDFIDIRLHSVALQNLNDAEHCSLVIF